MANSATVVCAVLVMCMVVPSSATVYTVGDTAGWAMGNDYTTWTSGKASQSEIALVSPHIDQQLFNYGGGHTVDEVSGSDYNTCTIGNSVTSDQSSPTTISLKTAGTHYFICAVPGHCSSGMKLAVKVATAGSSTPPSSSSGSGTTTNTTTPTSRSSSSGAVSPSMALLTTWVTFCLRFFS